jgi:hypothetical protein
LAHAIWADGLEHWADQAGRRVRMIWRPSLMSLIGHIDGSDGRTAIDHSRTSR